MDEKQDRLLTCVDCGKEFLFSVDEQNYFYSKKLSTPKRCAPCRAIRRNSIVPDPTRQRDESR